MKANRAYRLIVRRGGWAPAFMAEAGRTDRVEIVEVDTGEVALFWDLEARRAARLARALKTDLAQLEADAFITAWRDASERHGARGRSG